MNLGKLLFTPLFVSNKESSNLFYQNVLLIEEFTFIAASWVIRARWWEILEDYKYNSKPANSS